MEMLAALTPRSAGTTPLEVKTTFAEEAVAVAAQVRCPISCACSSNTKNCLITGGRSFFYGEN